ncbi:MAG: DUF882 domain-containing protein [Candidatus Marinimicrobia bacterium]|jgi:hypothetical protein|nr:DUF882 domain-containing protein [Candidatus Neomarinimicrobiota bacterium]
MIKLKSGRMKIEHWERYPNFNADEFKCSCCGLNVIDRKMVGVAQDIRYISGLPVIITCGCRCYSNNKLNGGNDSSKHMNGQAFDYVSEDYDFKYLARLAMSARLEIVVYQYKNHKVKFVHVGNPINKKTKYSFKVKIL